MVLLALFVLLIAVPALEIYVVIQVGQAIGAGPTIALLILDALIGSMLMRSQGRAVWRRFRETVADGRIPAREVLDGVLVLCGGAFLIAPGFVTDVIGALLLLPPTRAMVRRRILRLLGHRLMLRVVSPGWRLRASAPRSSTRRPPHPDDVEGSAVEVVDGRELRP